MKFLSWNYKGLSRLAAVRILKVLIHSQASDVLFLSETKTFPPQVFAALNRLGFYFMFQFPTFGASDGLVIAWQPRVNLKCFSANNNHI